MSRHCKVYWISWYSEYLNVGSLQHLEKKPWVGKRSVYQSPHRLTQEINLLKREQNKPIFNQKLFYWNLNICSKIRVLKSKITFGTCKCCGKRFYFVNLWDYRLWGLTMDGVNDASFTWCVSPSLLWLCMMLLRSLCMDCTVTVSGSLSVVDRAPNCRYLYKTYKHRVMYLPQTAGTCIKHNTYTQGTGIYLSKNSKDTIYITEVLLSKLGTIHTSPNTVYTTLTCKCIKQNSIFLMHKNIQANMIHLCDHE